MLGYAWATVRARASGLAGAFVALLAAAALVTACGMLLETGLRGTIQTERYAGTPVVVTADQHVRERTVTPKDGKPDKVKEKAKPLFERAWLPADTAERIARVPGVSAAIPEVTFPVTAFTDTGEVVAGPGAGASWGHSWESADLTPFALVAGRPPESTGEVVLDEGLAASTGVHPEGPVTLQVQAVPTAYTVVGVARAEGGPLTSQSTVFFSPVEAAQLAGREGQVTAVGVFPSEGTSPADAAAAVEEGLAGHPGVVHRGPERGSAEFLDAAGARTQLVSMGGAMAGTSLIVAVLVVVGTFSLSVQQRRGELALLRAVAASPAQVRRLIGREAFLIAIVAATLGACLGLLLGSWLHAAFVDLGAVPPTLTLAVSPFPSLAAVLLTVAGAVVAARISARPVARIRPVEALSDAALPRRLVHPARLLAGVLALGAGVVLLVLLTRLRTEPAAGPVTFLTVLTWSTAVAMLGPLVARLAVLVLGLPLRLSRVSGHLAAANGRAQAARLGAVIAPLSLMVAMAATVLFVPTTLGGAGLEQAAAGQRAGYVLTAPGAGVAPEQAAEVRRLPGVTAATEVVHSAARVDLERYAVQGVTAAGLDGTLDLGVSRGTVADLSPDTVAVSTLLAERHGVGPGDRLEVALGDTSLHELRVVAVYERSLGYGDLTVDHGLLSGHVDQPLATALLVAAGHGFEPATLEEFAAANRLHLLDGAGAETLRAEQQRSNAQVNYLALGLVVAFAAIAVVNTLAMSTAERTREFALLRLVGTTRRQIRAMLRMETLVVTGASMLIGTGIALATLTAFSIGMTGQVAPRVEPGVLAGVLVTGALLALGSTMIAGRLAMTARPERVIGLRP